MENDILMKAIKETAEMYVKDNVKVNLYKIKPAECSSEYALEFNFNNVYTLCKLDNRYCKLRKYIMAVVSDLCIDLAERTQREKNDFFKISDEKEK